MDLHSILFLAGVFTIAFLYASVGHGGASGYLALMAMAGMSPDVMKPSALMLNMMVSLVSFIQFYRSGHFRKSLFWPLVIGSIPAAFIGALLPLDAVLYKRLLGIVLLFPVLRFLGAFSSKEQEIQPSKPYLAVLIGVLIGLLSGILGIGGGILLSPILLLFAWANMKQTAAISAIFIFLNSAAGMAGQAIKGLNMDSMEYVLVFAAFTGGLIGSYYGSKKLNNTWLKRILGIVLGIASFKLLSDNATSQK